MSTEKENDFVGLELQLSPIVSYYMLQTGVSPFNRLYVKNYSDEEIDDVTVEITSQPGFLLPFSKTVTLPRKSVLNFEAENLISPVFTVALSERSEGEITVKVSRGGKTLCVQSAQVTLLAFNECDFSSRPESLAAFVRKSSALKPVGAMIEKKLTSWKQKYTGGFYGESSKNDVRFYFAAVYAVLCEASFVRAEQTGDDLIVADAQELIKNKTASSCELALLFASLLENAGINCVFGRSGGAWYVGAFLSDECFGDTVIDDSSLIENKIERGVNEISMVSVSGIFEGLNFESNEKRTVSAIKKQGIEFFVDLKYARMMNVLPLPERVKTAGGYDLKTAADYSDTALPRKIEEIKGNLSGGTLVTREKQWERRLLDLDMRNPLLNFKVSAYTVKILTAKLDDFIASVPSFTEFELRPTDPGETTLLDAFKEDFTKTVSLKPVSDLLLYEYKNKHLRLSCSGKDFERALTNVYRKEKSRQEESGTASLYLAAGFLKWSVDETDYKYAPVLLYPVTMVRRGGLEKTFSVSVNEDEVHVNTTLLEYLYQQFNIDVRALSEFKAQSLSGYAPVLARIKKEVSGQKGWAIYDSVYLCSLSFSSYLMWKDVRTRMDKFRESKLIRSLLENRSEYSSADATDKQLSSDEAYLEDGKIYLPISADSSQYSAIVDSLSKSFVLHGPPGTGKSQTITNMIANNIVNGRRVLFVAEKMAALSVVYKRLKDIGLGDFCLELYSEKTKKTDVVDKLVNTMSLAGSAENKASNENRKELSSLIRSIQGEMEAMHTVHSLGFSVYEGILGYLDNKDAPDCLTIDSLFYEKLNKNSFNRYLGLLTELSLRAKECGNIEKSPFRDVGRFDYNERWRVKGESILQIYYRELKTLKSYARNLIPVFNMRTVSLTREKIKGLYEVSRLINGSDAVKKVISGGRENVSLLSAAESYLSLIELERRLKEAFSLRYGEFPEKIFTPAEVLNARKKDSSMARLAKKYAASVKTELEKEYRADYYAELLKIAQNRFEIEKRAEKLKKPGFGEEEAALIKAAEDLRALTKAAKNVYADFDVNVFFESCRYIAANSPFLYLEYFASAYESAEKARAQFSEIFALNENRRIPDIDRETEYVLQLMKNLDLIAGWSKYQEIVEECRKSGFEFVLEPLNVGEITPDDILSCFKKCVYYNFVRSEISLDDRLCQFSGLTLEEAIERFKAVSEEYERLVRAELYARLVESLPTPHDDGDHNLEKVILLRAQKNGVKGVTLRKLFTQIPTVMKYACPCMLMSPASATQFLDFDLDKFDLVIFDEASQVPTCKAVGTIARAKQVIVVGDPKQLPPTTFFGADFKDEEHLDVEDLESILDDCLAIGMPERHLLWHYRSHHESLIAFSNAMYYDNQLLTFPSPGEMNSKVTFEYVDGVYDRGGSKCNKKEAQELIKNILVRLRNPALKNQSIGVVTFNGAQQAYIEDNLIKALREAKLEEEAFERDEPVFVKNLENVQGDERDVILFSVGYGPDRDGKLSLNFGPLNQAGGYRRLNVAATRARMEMKVFSSIRANMIDLQRTSSQGVRGLKAFLEYAERGREMLVFNSRSVGVREKGIGEYIARELTEKGLKCVYDLGVSDFKIDVAVVDPRDPDKYILAVICDSGNEYRIKSVRDRVAMHTKILKTLGWNVHFLWTVNYLGNPKREINKIKDLVASLTKAGAVGKKNAKEITARYKRTYRSANLKPLAKAGPDYVLNDNNVAAIKQKIRNIVAAEGPVEENTLAFYLMTVYSVPKTAKKAVQRLYDIMKEEAELIRETDGYVYFTDKDVDTFRPLDEKNKRDYTRVCPYELVAAARCALELSGPADKDGLVKQIMTLMNAGRKTAKATEWTEKALELAVKEGFVILTVDGNYTV